MGSIQRRVQKRAKQAHAITVHEFMLPCEDCMGRAVVELKKHGIKFTVRDESVLTSGVNAQRALHVFRSHCEYLDLESTRGNRTKFAAFSFF